MGRPTVSEAPRGPSLGSEKGAPASPEERQPPFPLPPQLRLQESAAGELRFIGRWRPRAPLVLCPVLLVLSNLSWLAPEPLSAERLLASLLGWSVTLLLAWRCWPRRAQLTLRPATRQLIIGRETAGQIVSLPDTLRWRLIVEHPPELPQPRYRAVLLHGERSWPLLGNTDPAELLRDLGRVLASWPGTVEHEWQLPHGAEPWSYPSALASAASHAAATPEASSQVLQGSRADRGLRWSMIAMTSLVMLDLAYLVVSASARVAYVHPLSLVLPALAAPCLITISALVITRHPRLVLGTQLAQEHSVLGVRRVRHRVGPHSVRGVHLLSSRSARRGHLLVDSSEGALALLVEIRDAEQLRLQLLSSLGQPALRASESAESAPRRWQSG